MVKYEINKLHKVAQMGKEYCEHMMRYVTDERLMDTLHCQRQVYEEQMHKLEKVYYGLEDIGSLHSMWFSWMMKREFMFKRSTDDLIKALVKGNYMGVRTLTNFIQNPYNSEDSKSYARELLQAISTNIQQLLNEYIYTEDKLITD